MRIPLLLLGSLLLLTPGCGVDDIVVAQRTPGEMFLLTPENPHSERRVQIVARAKPDTEAKLSLLSIDFKTQPHWERPASGGSEVHPWFRVRLVDEQDGQVVEEHTTVVDDWDTSEEVTLKPKVNVEEEVSRFERTYRLEFDRQGPPSDGTLYVQWSSDMEVLTDGDHPNHIEVLMLQPSGVSAP
ncbi:hypothetical protein [Corallococcus sicarius]|uniref:Uncharacterized protein n=1 Tax=Corallococcus sicarius TaxID=2316726 RepID=A0A3A8P2V9_9BACT|nr:hypothetical protein [Corallococcus sicarius]RKH46742.1 hypothetical protein D7X12_04585 [Corallococcus sicarius]